MTRQMSVSIPEGGRVILYRGQRVDAKPTRRIGWWAVRARVDGAPRTLVLPEEALEPVDDIDLPAPESVAPRLAADPLTVPEDDRQAVSFALGAVVVLGGCLAWILGGG